MKYYYEGIIMEFSPNTLAYFQDNPKAFMTYSNPFTRSFNPLRVKSGWIFNKFQRDVNRVFYFA